MLPELDKETISDLLVLAGPLGISEDDLYMRLIDRVLQQWKDDKATPGPGSSCGSPYPPTPQATTATTRFNAIQAFLQKIRDAESAINMTKRAADAFGPGSDRVAALKYAIKLLRRTAIQAKKLPEEQRIVAIERIEAMYSQFARSLADASAEILLGSHGLDRYVPLFVDATADHEAALR
ncbi:hypothetical protein EV182_008101, partial [Spiromyces aspiralis]